MSGFRRPYLFFILQQSFLRVCFYRFPPIASKYVWKNVETNKDGYSLVFFFILFPRPPVKTPNEFSPWRIFDMIRLSKVNSITRCWVKNKNNIKTKWRSNQKYFFFNSSKLKKPFDRCEEFCQRIKYTLFVRFLSTK